MGLIFMVLTSRKRIITNPVRLTGVLTPRQVSSLVAIDAMARRTSERDDETVVFELPTLSDDIATQHVVERSALRSSGELERMELVQRAQEFESEAIVDLRDMLAELKISAHVDAPDSQDAARIAFVRLYEAGLLRYEHAVVDVCPTCETVVDAFDVDERSSDAQVITLAIPTEAGELEMITAEPELLVGAAAIAVPPESPAAWLTVEIPGINAVIPVISLAGVTEATAVLPGHDAWSFDVATALGLPVEAVVDNTGVLRSSGCLEGMSRYAARSVAIDRLSAADVIVQNETQQLTLRQCRRCATTVIPTHGAHWLFALGELTGAFCDAVRDDAIRCTPTGACEQLVSVARDAGDWCISQQLLSGRRIPVATCLDCGQLSVSVSDDVSCKSCMGTLQPHEDVLDSRFVAAMNMLWHLVSDDAEAVLSIPSECLAAWAVPVGAIGLKLYNAIPYNELVLLPTTPFQPTSFQQMHATTLHVTTYVDLVREKGARLVRAELLLGEQHADRAVDVLERPAMGNHPAYEIVRDFDDAVLSLDATQAMNQMVEIAQEGVQPSASDEFARLAETLLGEHE